MVIILGPTSTGKTSLALRLCSKYNGSIISADSRQVYKYMDVGTNKLSMDSNLFNIQTSSKKWVINNINIYLYDMVKPDQMYSVANFIKDANHALTVIKDSNKYPFLVGGTGFYIESFLKPMEFQAIPRNNKLRQSLQGKSLNELRSLIPENIIQFMNNSDLNNPRRLIRKVEISEYHKKYSEQKKSKSITNEKHLIIGLYTNRDIMYNNTDLWIENIWNSLIDEVIYLLEKGYKNTAPMKSIIYKSVVKTLDGRIREEDSMQKCKYDLHKYIRKQQTWFNKMKNINWFDIQDENMFEKIDTLINKTTLI